MVWSVITLIKFTLSYTGRGGVRNGLRDAAAVALYGYKGANGVVNIVTKRGLYKKREISLLMIMVYLSNRLPEMSDSYTYARAMNEALANDGKLLNIVRMN